ncbi:MAG TPA: MlaD family protein [Treponemataceae bacterium]|nr:MlaD family protein [Treponemataceae bacterium]
MKFKIRYADQIVGGFVIAAFVLLTLVVFMLGSKQRWFSKDYDFRTTFDSATGINVGMPLLYKGFTIGKVKSLKLNDDNQVEVKFVVFDTYYDRAKEGSLVELIVSPIGLGNQFLFHPGNGAREIAEGSFIPRADTPAGKALVELGLVEIPKRDDTISNLIAQVNPLLQNINGSLEQLQGKGKGPLAETLANVAGITGEVNGNIGQIMSNVRRITEDVNAVTSNLKAASSSPDGLVPALLDPDGTMFASIEASLKSVEGMCDNLEGTSGVLKSEMPQLGRLIEDLRIAVINGQDVLEALKNNPLLKNGVPERIQTDSSGTNSRDIDF